MKEEVKKNDITREKLIILMSRYIKTCAKELNENTFSAVVPIRHENWYSKVNGRNVWSFTRINVGRDTFNFYDCRISEGEFLTIVGTALRESNCKGKIETRDAWGENAYGRMYSFKEFKTLTLLGKPCKQFVTLNRMLKKYTNNELQETEVYTGEVCGKRSSWSVDESSKGYLCYQPKKCQDAIDFIRKKKTSRDVLKVKVENVLDHGDEYEYKIAQYQESEWYGSEKKILELVVNTPSGKEKAAIKIVAHTR